MASRYNPRGGQTGGQGSQSKRYGWGPGQTNVRNTRGTRGPPLPTVPETEPLQKIVFDKPFVRGMILAGPGIDPVAIQGNNMNSRARRRNQNDQIRHLEGSGTVHDPTVGWCFDPLTMDGYTEALMRDHVDIARNVARANNFKCILIRKEVHRKQCTYTVWNTRAKRTLANGRQVNILEDADSHLTVFMGPDAKTAMVGGHIFVFEAYDPKAGRIVLRQMDNPVSQRTIVAENKQPVAVEFWITKGAWDVDDARR